MSPTPSTDDLERALRAALPPEHQAQAAALACALVTRHLDPTLRPVIRAMAGQELKSGGALIAFGNGSQIGDVSIGDVVGGDKITIAIPAPPALLTPQEQRNRQAMLQKVRAIWVDGLHKNALAEVQSITLGLAERPDAVQLPLYTQYQELHRPPRDIPAGTPIYDVFTNASGSLLMLGAPGSGKTTLLLELCRDLLLQAEHTATQPIPVVFNLSSWGVQRATLDAWLIEELSTRYDVPRKIARAWVETDSLLPLLDGLDEVASPYRDACVAAINTYQRTHLVPLAVCARLAEYEALSAKLRLQGAVVVQPLTPTAVDAYLTATGNMLAGVREALTHDAGLRELAVTPLMLTIMTLAYQDRPSAALNIIDGDVVRQTHLFHTYIEHMFQRRGTDHRYSRQQISRSLAWLARTLIQRSQTVFVLEHMQPDWLTERHQRWRYGFGEAGLPLLGVGAGVGLYYGLLIGLQPDLLNAMLPPLGGAGRLLLPIVGAIIGALSAFPAALASSLVDHLAAHHLPRWPLLGRMVRVAVGFGLLSSLITGILIGPQTSLFIGLVFGPIVGSLGGVVMPLGQIVIREVFGWSWKRAGIGVLIGLGLGFIVGGIYQQVTGASAWLWFWLGLTPIGTAVLLGLRGSTIETRLRPNQGIRRSVRMAVLVGGVSAVLISLLVLLIGGLPGTPSAAPTYLTALALSLGMVSGMLFSLPYGGMAALQHLVMRWLLARQGALPFQLVSFLDDCADRTFLRRVGGGYIFTHRLLMEHFAAMTDEDIARLSTEIEAGRR